MKTFFGGRKNPLDDVVQAATGSFAYAKPNSFTGTDYTARQPSQDAPSAQQSQASMNAPLHGFLRPSPGTSKTDASE